MKHPIKFKKNKEYFFDFKIFKKQISPRAIIVQKKIFLYFSGDLKNNKDSTSNIYLTISKDGINWDLIKKPVLSCSFSSEIERVLSPVIIKIRNNNYIMLFSAFYKVNTDIKKNFGENLNLGSLFFATSKNGIDWSVNDKPILKGLIGYYGYGSPFVLQLGKSNYKLFFHKRTNLSFNICCCDLYLEPLFMGDIEEGVFKQTKLYEKNAVYSPYVIFDEENWHMYYAAWGGDPVKGRILYASSSDGLLWIKHKSTVINPDNKFDMAHCSEPDLINFNNKWHLFYEGCDLNGNWRILSAIEE